MDPQYHDTAKQLQEQLTEAYPLFRWRVIPEILFDDYIVFEVSTVATINGKSIGAFCHASRELIEDHAPDALSEIAGMITSKLIRSMLNFGKKARRGIINAG